MDFKPLYEFMEYITKMRVPGCECLVSYKNELVFHEVCGFSDIENNKKAEKGLLHNMYSLTKPITCVAALTLVDDGKLSLSDPLEKYLPEFSEMYIKDGEAIKKAQNKITIEQLFTMTSGIAFNVRTKHILNAEKEGRISTREIVGAIAKDTLSFEPGEKWEYGLSHDVLGAVIEALTNKKFGEFLKERIFDPLGMENTTFHMTDDNISKMATQYFYNSETRKCEKVAKKNNFKLTESYESGGAGLISCASDYMLFANMLTNRGKTENVRILKEETVDLMRKNHLNEAVRKYFVWESMPDYSYGLGVRVMAERERFNSPSANGEFGWGGASGTYMLADPENALSIVYFQHMLNSWEEFVHPRIRNLTYKIIGE